MVCLILPMCSSTFSSSCIHRHRPTKMPSFQWTFTMVRPFCSLISCFNWQINALDTPVIVKERPKTVRLLPYVLVPGMDTSSRIFHKAQATIAKQTSAVPISSTQAAPQAAENLFVLQQGMSVFYLLRSNSILKSHFRCWPQSCWWSRPPDYSTRPRRHHQCYDGRDHERGAQWPHCLPWRCPPTDIRSLHSSPYLTRDHRQAHGARQLSCSQNYKVICSLPVSHPQVFLCKNTYSYFCCAIV